MITAFLPRSLTLALLHTQHLDPSDCTRITVPITRIPATLGRSHETIDENFFGLGPKKALSREQCRIYYQAPNGGRFVLKENKFVYEAHKGNKKRQVILLDENEPLPEQGFFAIECLGKNKITVGKNRVEQGQVAQLESGTPIRMSTVCLFFLEPTDAKEETMDIPAPKPKRQRKTPKTDAMSQELEAASVDDLLKEIREAIDLGTWERRQQLTGTFLAYHAVKDASRSKKIRALVRENGGASRKEIMDWMAASRKYGFWVKHTLNRIELSSYQVTVNRALQKAGYERLTKHGRYVKWKLPPSAEVESEVSDEEADDSDGWAEQNDSEAGKASDDDAKMSDTGKEEEEEEDSSDDDDAKMPAEESAVESKGKASNDDDDGDSSDDSGDSSDDNIETSSKAASATKGGSGDGSDSDEGGDSDDSDSSNDEKALASEKADEEMENAESDEGESSSGASDDKGDEIMADAEEDKSPNDE